MEQCFKKNETSFSIFLLLLEEIKIVFGGSKLGEINFKVTIKCFFRLKMLVFFHFNSKVLIRCIVTKIDNYSLRNLIVCITKKMFSRISTFNILSIFRNEKLPCQGWFGPLPPQTRNGCGSGRWTRRLRRRATAWPSRSAGRTRRRTARSSPTRTSPSGWPSWPTSMASSWCIFIPHFCIPSSLSKFEGA